MPRSLSKHRKRNKQAKASMRRWQRVREQKEENRLMNSQHESQEHYNRPQEPPCKLVDVLSLKSEQQLEDIDLEFNAQNLNQTISSWANNKYQPKFSKAVLSESNNDSVSNEEETTQKPIVIEGFRTVDLNYVLKWAVPLQFKHSKVCTTGKLFVTSEKQQKDFSDITFGCSVCDRTYKFSTKNPHKI